MASRADGDPGERYGDLGCEDGRLAQRRARERAGAGPSFAGRGPKGYRRSDERIREDVCDRLMADPALDPSGVAVHVADGEVTLEGDVPAAAMKRGAEASAASVLGVRQVHDRLRVAASGRDAEVGTGASASGARRDARAAEDRPPEAGAKQPL